MKVLMIVCAALLVSGCGLNLKHTQVEEAPAGGYKKVHHTVTFDTEPRCVASCDPTVKSW